MKTLFNPQSVIFCNGATGRQAFVLGRIEIGRGSTDEEALENLLSKLNR